MMNKPLRRLLIFQLVLLPFGLAIITLIVVNIIFARVYQPSDLDVLKADVMTVRNGVVQFPSDNDGYLWTDDEGVKHFNDNSLSPGTTFYDYDRSGKLVKIFHSPSGYDYDEDIHEDVDATSSVPDDVRIEYDEDLIEDRNDPVFSLSKHERIYDPGNIYYGETCHEVLTYENDSGKPVIVVSPQIIIDRNDYALCIYPDGKVERVKSSNDCKFDKAR